MDHAVSLFPLFHLPFTAQKRVSRNMDGLSQLAFSILSKKTTYLVKSLKMKLYSTKLSIGNTIRLDILLSMSDMFILFEYGEGELKSVEMSPENLRLKYDSWTLQDEGSSDEEEESDEEDDGEPWEDIEGLDYLEVLNGDEENVEQEVPAEHVIQLEEQHNNDYTVESVWTTNLTLRNWILHIQNIYTDSHIQILQFNGRVVFNLSSIKTALRDIEILMVRISRMDTDELFKEVTDHFLPAKRLEILHRPEDLDYLQRVSLSNFHHFSVTSSQFPYFESLDRLLTINASTIFISFFSVSDKTINKFLKLWIEGAMPRLRHMWMQFISLTMAVKKDAILSGIRYTERQQDEERSGMFEWKTGPMRFTVKGGFDIMKPDGVKATIRLNGREDHLVKCSLFVWKE